MPMVKLMQVLWEQDPDLCIVRSDAKGISVLLCFAVLVQAKISLEQGQG